MKKIKELQALKEKMLALQAGDYDVEAENPKVVKCWERLDCEKTDCPAYGRLRCWSIAGTSCHGRVQGEFAQKLGDCRECVVYKESCGDEISEFVEVFNQMVKDIKFNFHQLAKNDKERAKSERTSEMGNMVAAVAHETRNPLHAIGIAASYLKKNFHGELVTEFLDVIEEEVNKLNALTTIFLNFANPAPLCVVTCDLNEIIRQAVSDFSTHTTPQNKISLDITGNMAKIPCDKARISEALQEMLKNSIEASEDDDEIIISTQATDKGVRISVADKGCGIAKDELDNIFKPFYTTKTNGPGLGLATVERIAGELNGSISVETKEGEGSIFQLDLPGKEEA